MKVVLFCCGLDMHVREDSEAIPKPMVPIGYARFEHKDFIVRRGILWRR